MSVYGNKINRLLTRFKSGDKTVFKELFDFCYKKFLVIAGSILRDKSLAEDVVSQTFLKVCESIEAFDESQDGYNWLLTILKRKAFDINKQQKNCFIEQEEETVEEFFDCINNKSQVYMMLRKLDDLEQKIIYMRYFEDKTFNEIGEEIGVSAQMVHKKVDIILKKLKKIYENG